MHRRILFGLALTLLSTVVSASQTPKNIGFYYGHEAPVSALMTYDWLVLQPAEVSPARVSTLKRAHTLPLAYISVGEIARTHQRFSDVPKPGLLAENPAWDSRILDIRRDDVQDFIVDRLIAPTRQAGFEGVFLDTLDSFRLTGAGRQHPADFIAAEAKLIRRIHATYPDSRIIINRGFYLPESVHELVDALAFESYREGFDPTRKRFRPVPRQDRDWLDAQLDHWRDAHPDKPLIAIDYVEQPARAAQVARQLRSDGLIPYVSDPDLLRLGPTQPRRIRREILVFHDETEQRLSLSAAHRYAGMVLEELGYIPVYRHTSAPLPREPLTDRYAGILVWWERGESSRNLCQWLVEQQSKGMRVVAMGLLPSDRSCQTLIRSPIMATPKAPLQNTPHQASVGQFEGQRLPVMPASSMPRPEQGHFWLTVTDANGESYHPIYTHKAGGVALDPYLFEPGPDDQRYWLFNPFQFLREAFDTPDMPVTDVTTETGRRILTSHIDGDGFVSRAEMPGAPLGAQVLLDDILTRYPIPHTVSVIEAETSPQGIYPASSTEAETVARKIFQLKNVEVASHSFSHPFFWQVIESPYQPLAVTEEYGYSLNVPGYRPTLEREIGGSVNYINQRLAPANKPVSVFLWSGDALPGEKALRQARDAGLLNVNGGDTHPLPFDSELAGVWPIARPVGDELQIYAPVMNENLYTNLWHGPFYGFRDVIKTFQLLEDRGRLKPISIYYHFYSGTKPSALKALQSVYDYALSQPVTPLFLSDYAKRARFVYRSALLQTDDGQYLWRGMGAPHTVRIEATHLFPDFDNSQGVAGYIDAAGKRYVHLTGSNPQLALTASPPDGPYLRDANAVLTHWQRTATKNGWRIELGLAGHQPLRFNIAGAAHCRSSGQTGVSFTAHEGLLTGHLPANDVNQLTLECR